MYWQGWRPEDGLENVFLENGLIKEKRSCYLDVSCAGNQQENIWWVGVGEGVEETRDAVGTEKVGY